MALPAAHTKAADVITDLDLSQDEFDWVNRTDSSALDRRVAMAIRKARARVIKRVGTANYSSTDDVTLETVKVAEFDLSCADMMRQRAVILTSRPEEAPPPEYINIEALLAIADAREASALAELLEYQTDDGDAPGTGFSFGSTGIDETKADYGDGDYEESDFDELPN